MPAAPKPPNETARLAALRRYGILDTAPEPGFDRVTQLVSRLLDVPIALVSLVDDERQWFKSCFGIDIDQTDRDIAFCAHAILSPDVMEVPDALLDPRFAENPVVTGEPRVRAYVGAPLVTPDHHRIGTLCAIDMKPREFTAEQLASMVDLAAIVVDELELRKSARDRKLFERVTQTSPNIMYVLDMRTGAINWTSPAALQLFGFEPADLGDDVLRRIFHPDDLEPAKADMLAVRKLPDAEHKAFTSRVKGVAGDYRWLHTRATPFERDARGHVTEILAVAIEVTALKEAEARVAQLAVTDELTKLPNRRGLKQRLDVLAAEAARGRRFSVAIADIDFFKKVNDTHGHAVGDQVLVAVAAALQKAIRKSDLVARMGGEEFCIVQTDVDPALTGMLTERLRAAVEAITEPLAVTASFGVCHSRTTADPAAMLETADAALYRAKGAGRNRVVVCD